MTIVPLASADGQSRRASAMPSRVRIVRPIAHPPTMTDTATNSSHSRTTNGVAHLQLNRPERMNTMTPAFFPAVRDAVRRPRRRGRDARPGDLVDRQALLGRHVARRLRRRLRGAGGDDAARAARLPGVAEEADRLLQRPRRGALPGRLRDPGRLHRRRPRPCHRLRHPRLQRRRVLHRAGDLDRHGRRPRRPAALAEDRAARRRARDGLHRRAPRRRARARGRARQRRPPRRRPRRSIARSRWRGRSPRSRRSRSPAPSSRSTTRATTRPRRRCSR